MKHTNKLSGPVLSFIFTLVVFQTAFTQEWDIPANKKNKNSYIPFTAAVAKEGEAGFNKNCQSCHGNPGMGNSLKSLKPIPPDLGQQQTHDRTDGDLFYIISTGRNVMPSFKSVVSEEDRWKIIGYIRSFHKGYTQVLSKVDPSKSKLVRFNVAYDSLTHQLKAYVFAEEPGGAVALKNDELSVSAGRYFGKLLLDKAKNTNEEGVALFNIPKDIPGDKNGQLDIFLTVNDDLYGEVEYQTHLNAGIPTDKPSLTEKRAIWNVLAKAPLWLIITYTSIVLAVFLTLGYILKSLFKINTLGKS